MSRYSLYTANKKLRNMIAGSSALITVIVEAFFLLDAVHYADSVVYVRHSECQISSVQWNKLCGTDQRAAFATRCTGNEYTLHFVGSSPSTDICGATWTFLVSGHCFRAGAFSGSHRMSLDHLLLTLCGSEGRYVTRPI